MSKRKPRRKVTREPACSEFVCKWCSRIKPQLHKEHTLLGFCTIKCHEKWWAHLKRTRPKRTPTSRSGPCISRPDLVEQRNKQLKEEKKP